jgi:L-threonylcarbamoyladenylate synthase
VPDHPLALELLAAFARSSGKPGDGGVAAPSANRFGRVSPTTAAHVREELGDRVSLILDGGPCQIGIESTIIDLSRDQPEILRPGHLGPERLARILGRPPALDPGRTGQAAPHAESALPDIPRVSGSLVSHYAPQTPVRLIASARLPDFLLRQHQAGLRCGVLAHTPTPPALQALPHSWRSVPADPDAYARDLYSALRDLDRQNFDLIVVEAPPDTSDWIAISDRLTRAATKNG